MKWLDESESPEKEEKRIILYFIGITITHISLVGGMIVFILLLLEIETQLLGGIFSAYLAIAFSIGTAFLSRPLEEHGIKKLFLVPVLFFGIAATALLLRHFAL